jgi:hypothetical protein
MVNNAKESPKPHKLTRTLETENQYFNADLFWNGRPSGAKVVEKREVSPRSRISMIRILIIIKITLRAYLISRSENALSRSIPMQRQI